MHIITINRVLVCYFSFHISEMIYSYSTPRKSSCLFSQSPPHRSVQPSGSDSPIAKKSARLFAIYLLQKYLNKHRKSSLEMQKVQFSTQAPQYHPTQSMVKIPKNPQQNLMIRSGRFLRHCLKSQRKEPKDRLQFVAQDIFTKTMCQLCCYQIV